MGFFDLVEIESRLIQDWLIKNREVDFEPVLAQELGIACLSVAVAVMSIDDHKGAGHAHLGMARDRAQVLIDPGGGGGEAERAGVHARRRRVAEEPQRRAIECTGSLSALPGRRPRGCR